MLKHARELPPLDRAAEEAYLRRYIDCFKRGVLSDTRVIVYQHSAVGRDILARILNELGAEVVTVGRSDTFVPIDTENITDDELDRLEAFATAAEKSGGRNIAAIVSTDGDSDRPLVTAVLPSAEVGSGARRVRFLPGDLLGIVVAEYLRADGAAVPISANDAGKPRMGQGKVALLQSKICSPLHLGRLR